ncbi:MAG: GntR family transcriptional regulator [Chloroflexi bacterium]|nr:GntR family transcriptional regulator [Chloroflexota bacterium]
MISLDPPQDRHKTGVPLYIQIAEGLLDRIEAGELVPGDRLPAERELSRALSVNRMTLRNALRVLEQQGLLIRRQGDGTYVAAPKVERQAGYLFSFTKGMRSRGYTPGAKIIHLERRQVEASIGNQLGLRASAAVYNIQRLRLLNREPVMLEEFTIPVERFPGLEDHDLESRSLYEIMEVEYHVSVTRARQSLEPVLATAFEAELLEIEAGSPLMLERRISFDEGERPIEHGKDLYRGDRFRFVTELAPLEL